MTSQVTAVGNERVPLQFLTVRVSGAPPPTGGSPVPVGELSHKIEAESPIEFSPQLKLIESSLPTFF